MLHVSKRAQGHRAKIKTINSSSSADGFIESQCTSRCDTQTELGLFWTLFVPNRFNGWIEMEWATCTTKTKTLASSESCSDVIVPPEGRSATIHQTTMKTLTPGFLFVYMHDLFFHLQVTSYLIINLEFIVFFSLQQWFFWLTQKVKSVL